jgi:DNA-binding NarL/FixJ family response regulator
VQAAPVDPRELDVLALMAQGLTNGAIAQRLAVSTSTVEKGVAGVFEKLAIPTASHDNRRVLSVLCYLAAVPAQATVPGLA